MMNQLFFLVTMAAATMARYMPSMPYQRARCEPVTNAMCKELDPKNYLYTSFPNYMNHSSAVIANRELKNYEEIIETGCSPVLKMFLCSLFVPICKPGVVANLPPCRSLCEEARRGCKPLLNSAHIRWPTSMNCDNFPEENTGLCVSLTDPQPPVSAVDEPIVPVANHIPSKRTNVINKGNSNMAIAMKELIPMQEIELKCDSDKQIMVKRVRHWPEQNTDCCPVDSLEAISKSCQGKQNCMVVLDKSIIGEGCVGTMKKTSVKYKCVNKDRELKVRKSIGCMRTNKIGN